jgi:hypothetical protein
LVTTVRSDGFFRRFGERRASAAHVAFRLATRSAALSFWQQMSKILTTLLVGSVVVGGVVLVKGASAASTPEGKMCVRLQDMCPRDDAKPMTFDQCVDGMKDVRKMAGNASFEKSARCVEESESCAAATGCLMGGVGMGVMGEMMKGFGNAMTK